MNYFSATIILLPQIRLPEGSETWCLGQPHSTRKLYALYFYSKSFRKAKRCVWHMKTSEPHFAHGQLSIAGPVCLLSYYSYIYIIDIERLSLVIQKRWLVLSLHQRTFFYSTALQFLSAHLFKILYLNGKSIFLI